MITQALQETTAPAFAWVARELVFADESARPLLLDAFSRHRNDSHRKLVKALEEAWHAVSWPSGEAYLRSLGWLPKGERGAGYAYDGDELMELLAHRLGHVAHRMFRDAQVRAAIDPQSPTRVRSYTQVMINRDHWHDEERNVCGIKKASLLSVDAGLLFLRQPAHQHPACDCTADPHPT